MNPQDENKKAYIRKSEIPESHRTFIESTPPVEVGHETEPCYSKELYDKWYERWENEGGQNVSKD